MSTQGRQQEMLERVEKAITNLKRGNKKLSISQIAKKAGIARKTIYNHPELKERCNQAIYLQEQQFKKEEGNENNHTTKPLSGRKLLEQRYKNAKEALKKEQEKNAQLLENNRQLVLEKEQLKSKIEMLQNQLERLKNNKVKPIR